jgi:D-alanyl-D-alanine carboxypeptidase (penicillin-binding protein 5/6)
MTLRSSRIILAFLTTLLVLLLAFRFSSDFLGPKNDSAQAVVDGPPVLTSPGETVLGAGQPTNDANVPQGTFPRVAWTVAPPITAHAALIADVTTGDILFNFNPGMRWPIASLTKLMSAEVIKDQMDLSKNITLTASDFEGGGSNLTRALEPGATYRGTDLLKIMLTSSSNEAAEAFARTYGRAAFVAAMNAQAAAWGLLNTNFSDASGLAASDQSTTKDYKELALHVWRAHPELFLITRLPANSVIEQNSGLAQTFLSTNMFAGRPDFLGGKTGTTPEAGENLLTFFSYRSHPVMILLFGSGDRFGETESLFQWFTHDFSASN